MDRGVREEAAMNKKNKKSAPRLTLNRETVRQLNDRELTAAEAAAGTFRSCTVPFTDCPLCDPFT
jgi:hypothetical protein